MLTFLPSKIRHVVLPYVGATAMLAMRINRSPKALLVVLLAIYWLMWLFGPYRPATIGELVIWFSNLPGEIKGAAISSLLTVVGFVVAFGTTQAAWRKQRYAEHLLKIADEITDHFNPPVSDANILLMYAADLLKAQAAVRSGPITMEQMFHLQWIVSRQDIAREAYDRIWKASVSAHSLKGKYSLVLLAKSNNEALLSALIDDLSSLADLTYGIYKYESADHLWIVLPTLFETEKWQRFAEGSTPLTDQISMRSGAIRGNIQMLIIEPTIVLAARLFRALKQVPPAALDMITDPPKKAS